MKEYIWLLHTLSSESAHTVSHILIHTYHSQKTHIFNFVTVKYILCTANSSNNATQSVMLAGT